MHIIRRVATCALLILTVFATKPAFAQGQILTQGAGGVLTSNAASAFIEALKFMHAQIGEPVPFSDAQMTSAVTTTFAGLPLGDQNDIANMPAYWAQIRTQWPILQLENKQQIAYQIFRLAYGEAIASRAVGEGSSNSGSSVTEWYSDGSGSHYKHGSNGCSYVSTPAGSMRVCE